MSIQEQFNNLRSQPPEYIGVGLENFNFNHWKAYISGPSGTPYEGGLYTMDIKFSSNYPRSPPKIVMITQIFHPNIDDDGEICIDVIKNNWKSTYTMRFILNAIVGLLKYPNAENPWPSKQAIADLLRYNKPKFERKAREYTSRYAM